MKSLNFLFTIMLLAALSCTPKNEEVTDEQVEVGEQTEVLDSIANARKDAVKTDNNETSPTLPLPPAVLQLVANKYPGFEQPVLAEEVKQKTEAYDQGPIIVRGDFNGDIVQDYALQLQQEEDIIVVAAVSDTTNNSWALHELKQDIMFNDRGVLKSLYYLYLMEAGSELNSLEEKAEIEIPYDAVVVRLNKSSTTFLYQEEDFKAYPTGE